ncbi:MAG: FAD-binding protein [Verrucomicrobiota bacterium]|nr:FAD-binding protein [Verrucomicrobiota bacterium]
MACIPWKKKGSFHANNTLKPDNAKPLSAQQHHQPREIDELAECVSQSPMVIPHGNLTKPALVSMDADKKIVPVDMTQLRGILNYDPDEFVFTALAGTPVSKISKTLAEHGQFLPFDPPFSSSGATLGGTVAAGLNGPGQFRYGGVRDFIIGVKFIDGAGQKLKGGGKVVKNSAGFDFPKLFVGSLGRLGILYELTFKVFPAPQAYMTLSFNPGNIQSALDTACLLAGSSLEPFAIDIVPPGRLEIRIGGNEKANESTAGLIEKCAGFPASRITGQMESETWDKLRDFKWAQEEFLIKVALNPSLLCELDNILEKIEASRHYSAAGNVAYISTERNNLLFIDDTLKKMKLSGVALRGDLEYPRLGWHPARKAETKIQSAMDREGKFLPL